MTINTVFVDWQAHRPAPDPAFSHCSPNLVSLYAYMQARWGVTDLGCYGVRPIRAGTEMSSHGFGAARDIRYGPAASDRATALNEIMPFLIDNSYELNVQAIHDYLGCRIW